MSGPLFCGAPPVTYRSNISRILHDEASHSKSPLSRQSGPYADPQSTYERDPPMKKRQAHGCDGVASHSNTVMSVAAPKRTMNSFPKWLFRMRHAFSRRRITGRFAFLVLGILSTVWFVVRVLPKPSRATYPCMQVATPFMSGLVVSLLGLLTTVGAFRKAKASLLRARYFTAACFLLLGFSAVFMVLTHDQPPVYADS